jgi:hypothetical protein
VYARVGLLSISRDYAGVESPNAGSRRKSAMRTNYLSQPLGCLALALALIPGPVVAQTDTASIVGTVSDSLGAVMPGVTVTATQIGTNLVFTTVTNAGGQYVFPTLRIGVYTITAELEGFRRMRTPELELNVQDRREINLTLELGRVTEEVQVKGETPLLQTESADIGYSVDERQLRDLPVLGRRYAELAFLTPGVVTATAGLTNRGEDTFFHSNGNYATWNNFMLDGADNKSGSTHDEAMDVIKRILSSQYGTDVIMSCVLKMVDAVGREETMFAAAA